MEPCALRPACGHLRLPNELHSSEPQRSTETVSPSEREIVLVLGSPFQIAPAGI